MLCLKGRQPLNIIDKIFHLQKSQDIFDKKWSFGSESTLDKSLPVPGQFSVSSVLLSKELLRLVVYNKETKLLVALVIHCYQISRRKKYRKLGIFQVHLVTKFPKQSCISLLSSQKARLEIS